MQFIKCKLRALDFRVLIILSLDYSHIYGSIATKNNKPV